MTGEAPESKQSLTQRDIDRLGVEAGHRVNAMPDHPTPEDIEEAVTGLALTAAVLEDAQFTDPGGS